MKKFDFLVCYDISNQKRLVKIAKKLEGMGIRIQKSIFFLQATSKSEINTLIESINAIIDVECDDVRIYKIEVSRSLHLAGAVNLKNATIIKAKS